MGDDITFDCVYLEHCITDIEKMDEAQNPVADRTHYGAAGNDGYMDRVLIHSFIEKYYGSCSRWYAGWYISGSKFESYSQRL